MFLCLNSIMFIIFTLPLIIYLLESGQKNTCPLSRFSNFYLTTISAASAAGSLIFLALGATYFIITSPP